ncbi:MAG TPA: arginine--tRNA ligase [Bacteroidales bacterium]|nr:arginine--tRNA ligase [Bacteroidales bacterium]HOK97977.1 arginine--tRNA ligase [Bacteroidales bacterium]HPO65288.1 arginine--tRNA ligase [Bacteroidales bacterium]
MLLEEKLSYEVRQALSSLYQYNPDQSQITFQKTRKEFAGDITLVVFPLAKLLKKAPDALADELGNYLLQNSGIIKSFNVIKGFLNLEISDKFWVGFLVDFSTDITKHGYRVDDPRYVMIEFSSPNTNKPLHLGHIRNNLLGNAVSRILQNVGHRIIKVNLVNDRGIHICKSMLAWQKFGNGATPQSTGIKGDHLVGDYYVRFDQEYKRQIEDLIQQGMSPEEAKKSAPILLEAQEMLRRWEAGDPEVLALWKMMNSWVYEGFDETYQKLGIEFDRIYYESETYMLGKKLVLEALEKGILYQKEDGSVWADLTDFGLDHKVLLRADGTSVYMTQDIGTAHQRFTEYPIDEHIYVVGNEQNYHFQALIAVLKKMGFAWADRIVHLSYGMVELPEGKMKSREGTVVDADDLIADMITTARQISEQQGKLDGLSEEEKNEIIRIVGMGALKYFILRVDPKKNMVFDPKESIDFNGNTGPFIQYSHARIHSVLRKANEMNLTIRPVNIEKIDSLDEKEKELIQLIYEFRNTMAQAVEELSPAVIANYCYELSKAFNQFYHELSILKVPDEERRQFRLSLAAVTAGILKHAMNLLGIEMPERM